MSFNSEQKSLLKALLIEILNKYNSQSITYNPSSNIITVNQVNIALPTSNPRSTISTRTTHIR